MLLFIQQRVIDMRADRCSYDDGVKTRCRMSSDVVGHVDVDAPRREAARHD